MKVLIVTPTPTHPTNQGNRARVLQIGQAFKKAGANVSVLYYALDGYEDASIDMMSNVWDMLYVVRPDRSNFRKSAPDVWQIDDWITASIIEVTRFISKTVKYDVVLVNYVWCSFLLEIFPKNVLKIIDTHDVFGGRQELAKETGIDPHWFYTSPEQEAFGLDRADIIIAIQEHEGKYFKSIAKSEVCVIEYAPTPNFLPSKTAENVTFGYIGSSNPWNVNSIKVFDEILFNRFGAIANKINSKFLLFGGITSKISDTKVFHSFGSVSNPIDAYSFMDIFINPMIGGTGLKIKTVEALSYGLPVVTTQSGGVGLEIISTEMISENFEDMIEKIINFSTHPQEARIFSSKLRNRYLFYYESIEYKIKKMLIMWSERIQT